MMPRIRNLLVGIILIFASSSLAIERKPISEMNSDNLVDETQVLAPCDADHFNICWWIPIEFWQAVFSDDSTTSQHDIDEAIRVLTPYFLVAVAQADISTFGAFDYYSKDEVATGMKVIKIDKNGESSSYEYLESINADAELLLEAMKPIFSAAMGNFGENFHFFAFSDIKENGDRVIDPFEQSKVLIQLMTRSIDKLEASIETPLNSLFVPRLCPNGKTAHVSWKFCPWSGEKLSE